MWWMWACEPEETTPIVTEPEPEVVVPATSDTAAEGPDLAALWPCHALVSIDEGQDGTIDGTGFDGLDPDHPTWLMFVERDDNGNGIVDLTGVYTRDADGNTLTYVNDSFSFRYEWTLGYLTHYELDEGNDGQLDSISDYTWDATGGLLTYEVDDDGDGALDYALVYTRDPDGARTAATEDADGDGDIDRYYAYTLDEQRRETLITGDDEGDGVFEYVRTYTYTDPVLRIGTSDLDDGNDGLLDVRTTFEYDADGSELYYANDNAPFDGIPELEETTTRDAEGRVLTYVYTVDGDTLAQSYAYDALGRRLLEAHTYGTATVTYQDESATWVYSAACP